MFLRVDPSVPVVWRDADTVQFGLDPERTRLGPVDIVTARGIAELVKGTSLARLASVVGGEEAASRLVDSCGDVFDAPRRAALPRLGVVGIVPATETIAQTWVGSTRSTTVAAASADLVDRDIDFVILVSHFVVSPIDIQPWLGRDVPHLAVVFGESSVRIGPVVRPGVSACIRCVELAHIDVDPAWSAVAPQVWRRTAAADTIPLAIHAAAESLGLFAMGGGYSIRIDAVTLSRVTAPHHLHPECGCVSLTVNSG